MGGWSIPTLERYNNPPSRATPDPILACGYRGSWRAGVGGLLGRRFALSGQYILEVEIHPNRNRSGSYNGYYVILLPLLGAISGRNWGETGVARDIASRSIRPLPRARNVSLWVAVSPAPPATSPFHPGAQPRGPPSGRPPPPGRNSYLVASYLVGVDGGGRATTLSPFPPWGAGPLGASTWGSGEGPGARARWGLPCAGEWVVASSALDGANRVAVASLGPIFPGRGSWASLRRTNRRAIAHGTLPGAPAPRSPLNGHYWPCRGLPLPGRPRGRVSAPWPVGRDHSVLWGAGEPLAGLPGWRG